MQRKKNKKTIVYFFLFLLLGSINNIKFNQTEFNSIKKIKIIGLSNFEEENILKEIYKLNLENIFFLNGKEITRILSSNNLIENFKIYKKYPSTLLIEIQKTNFLAKINKSGGVIWEKFFPTDGIGAIRGIDISSDDNIIITGFRNAPNTDEFQGFVFIAEDSEGFVMKLDSNGNVIWDKTLNFSQGTKVREIIDGYAVISCTWQNSGDGDNMEFSLAKLNENGEIIWEKHLGGSNHDHLYDFDVTSDGGFILGGHTLSYGVVNWDYLLMRVDSNGDEVWHKTFGQPRGYDPNYIHDEAYGVRQTSDGGFIIVGGSGDEHSYSSSDHPSGPSDEWKVYIVKTDENGEKIWDDVYHVIMNSNNDELNEIIDMIKIRKTRLREDASRNFVVGDWVTFDAGKRGKVTGVVSKVNSKSVLVRQSVDKNVMNWKVDPSLLKLAVVA